MVLNKSCVGKSYPPTVTEVTLEAIQKYARACNDHNPSYYHPAAPAGIVASPMFNVVVSWLPLITALTDPDLHADLLRLLHASQDMEFFVSIRPGDMISAAAKIISIESVGGGETITVQLDATNHRGEPVSRTCFTAIIRGRRNRDGMTDADRPAKPIPRPNPILNISQTIDRDQASRYADASGDRNPIHTDENVARMAGLPGVIVHGLCTMALTSKVMIDHFGDGAPARLKRLAVKFSRPAFPGDIITTRVWRESDDDGVIRLSYETINPSGLAVIRDGVAEIGCERRV
jgi:acyl dehydratase